MVISKFSASALLENDALCKEWTDTLYSWENVKYNIYEQIWCKLPCGA